MDRHTPAQRSFNMSQVKSKNTKPELAMFKLLEEEGIKFEKHSSIAGNPDIIIQKFRLAIFIDGEFWHGKDFDNLKDTLSPFWREKICKNIKRDRKVVRQLRSEGWHIMRFWDKKVIRHPERSIKRIKRFLELQQKPDDI